MNLDNVINKAIQHTLYKKIKPRKKPIRNPEQTKKDKILYIIRRIKTGDFNPKLLSHQLALSLAVREGFVERKTLTILKEVA